MEGQEQWRQIRVVKIESLESWNFYLTKAAHQDSLVCSLLEVHFLRCDDFLNVLFAHLRTDLMDEFLVSICALNSNPSNFKTIVVHFTASWCMPSVAMNPFFDELAFTYPDALFLAVDVDEVKEVAAKLEIKAMPTFLLMKNGTQIDKLVGANPEEIRKMIDSHVETIHVA